MSSYVVRAENFEYLTYHHYFIKDIFLADKQKMEANYKAFLQVNVFFQPFVGIIKNLNRKYFRL